MSDTQILDTRQVLKKGNSISLRMINTKGEAIQKTEFEFTILSISGCGGSSVCYEALCKTTGMRGRLKELYPIDFEKEKKFFAIQRDPSSNQLFIPINMVDALEKFKEVKTDFLTAYDRLLEAKNKDHGLVNNYTPSFVLFEGMTASPGTIYVWTNQDKKINPFSYYLCDVKRDISSYVRAEAHLYNILKAMLTLSTSVSDLHELSLIHLDLNPSNVGFCIDKQGSIEPEKLSLYDTNTLHSVYDGFIKPVGTEGFVAPEIKEKGKVSTKCDIYSIGAILFHAIASSDGIDIFFEDSYYDKLEQYIANAKIIRMSDNNSNSKFLTLILNILKKTLAHDPKKRYNGCSYLVDDLNKAINDFVPAELRRKIELEKIKGSDIEKYWDKKFGANGAIQQLLLKHPLYENSGTAKEINALVLGAGTYAQRFIDIAFELSQAGNFFLNINAISNDKAADEKRYLAARPDFKNFFTLNGETPKEEPFGSLTFLWTNKDQKSNKISSREFSLDNDELNIEILLDALENTPSNVSYVFVALGNDLLNQRLADICNDLFNNKRNCNIAFVCGGGKIENSNTLPLYVNDTVSNSTDFAELKRMAMNAHMLWARDLRADKKQKRQLSNPYYYSSSLSNIVSIKYKFRAIGIDLEINDTYTAAKEFSKKVDKEGQALINALAMYEHNRWCVSLICNGWQTLSEDKYNTLFMDTKDKKNKLHPCLVRSNEVSSLSTAFWSDKNHAAWDDIKSDMTNLDPLDRMSIKLHRCFKSKANLEGNAKEINTNISNIENAISKHSNVVRSFEPLRLSILQIMAGENQTKMYGQNLENFKDAIKKLPKDTYAKVSNYINSIDTVFYNFAQSKKYIDYKAHDVALSKGIPFILTYSSKLNLCIPFNIEKYVYNNRMMFENVASVILFNPAQVTFVISDNDIDNTDALFRGIRYASNCFETKNLQTKINLLFLMSDENCIDTASLTEQLQQVSSKIKNIDFVLCHYGKSAIEKYLNKRRCSFNAIARNKGTAYHRLEAQGIYSKYPSFSYSPFENKLTTYGDCEYLKYVFLISPGVQLRASDIFDFQKAPNKAELVEFKNDYEFLWSLYKTSDFSEKGKQKEKCWKLLCSALKDYAQSDGFISFPYPQSDGPLKTTTVLVPDLYKDLIIKIINYLRHLNKKWFSGKTEIKYYNTSTYKIIFTANETISRSIIGLLSDRYKLYSLSSASKIDVEPYFAKNGQKEIHILFDTLQVENLSKDQLNSNTYPYVLDILQELNDKNYVYNLDISTDAVSFIYSSSQMKRLLTNEGKIFEVYVYYKATEENYFDDVILGCEIKWYDDKKESTENEIDLVLTKGAKVLIVEIKARTFLQQNFYMKLSSLTQRFGNNAKSVIIADTLETEGKTNIENDIHRSRGKDEFINVETIYKPDDIKNIGTVLKNIMEKLK